MNERSGHGAHGAPTAGLPPYRPYEITPQTVFGFGTGEQWADRSTRWRFTP